MANGGLFAIVGSTSLILAFVYSGPIPWGLSIFTLVVLVPLSVFTHRWAKQGRLDIAALAVAGSWYAIATGMILVG